RSVVWRVRLPTRVVTVADRSHLTRPVAAPKTVRPDRPAQIRWRGFRQIRPIRIERGTLDVPIAAAAFGAVVTGVVVVVVAASSLRIVPVACASASVAFTGLERLTTKRSS